MLTRCISKQLQTKNYTRFSSSVWLSKREASQTMLRLVLFKMKYLSIIFMFRSYFYIYMYICIFLTAWILLDGLCMRMHYNLKEYARWEGWESAYHWDTNQRIMHVSYNHCFASPKLRLGGYSAKYCIRGLFYYFQCTLSQHF